MGNARSFMAFVFGKEQSPQRLIYGLAHPFHTPCCELAFSSTKRGWIEEVMVDHVFQPHLCGQYLCLQNTDVDVHTPLVPLDQTLYLARRLQKTSE